MSSFRFKTSLFAMRVVERLINTRMTVSGDSYKSDRPTLFVINHFTRAETLLMPYIIYKATGKYAHSLADKGLFKGFLGDYLESMGVVSTGEKDRDLFIIRDLLTGENNWTIYPEGSMIKSKQIFKRGKMVMTTPNRIGPPHTGAAILALKAEIYRQQYIEHRKNNNLEKLEEFSKKLKIDDLNKIRLDSAIVIPVSISYYPLRPGHNMIKKLVQKFFKEVPKRLDEELEIEGNILINNTDMNIHFDEPIESRDYLKGFNRITGWVPVLGQIDKKNFLIKRAGIKLTKDFMRKIYTNVQLNFDHFYCASLRYIKQDLKENEFLIRLYLTIDEYRAKKNYRIHPDLRHGLSKMLWDKDYAPLKSIRDLAIEKEILTIKDGVMSVNHVKLNMMHMFHNVRVQNPLVVIANEIEPYKDLIVRLKRYINYPKRNVNEMLFSGLMYEGINRYNRDYDEYYNEEFSKDKAIGDPFYLRGKKDVGIVLCHGFLSAPREVRKLAEHLNSQGYHVYAPRLAGHGTSPENLATIQWEEWVNAYVRGATLLKQVCSEVIFGGFSTGGTIALIAATKVDYVKTLFAINPPTDMKGIGASKATVVHKWNTFMDSIKIKSAQMEYTDSTSSNPDVNYTRIYIKGLNEMDELMERCREVLKDVTQNVLIINSDRDPTVDPNCSKYIMENISSKNKKRIEVKADKHIIIIGDDCDEPFRLVCRFLERNIKQA